MQREFWVHVGRTAQPNTPVPLVIFLHGTSGSGKQYLNISRWREKADTAGFIAVFPSALVYCFRDDENNDGDMDDPGELHATSKWTQGSLGDTLQPLCRPRDYLKLSPTQRQRTMHRFQDDTLFLDAMVADLKANFLIDTKRMYIAGFSNGGEMVSRLLVVRSHLFAAMASHAGHMHIPPAPLGARRVPFLRSVGNKDDRYFSTLPGGTMPVCARGDQLPIHSAHLGRPVPAAGAPRQRPRVGAHDMERPPDRALESTRRPGGQHEPVRLPARRGEHSLPIPTGSCTR
jgi:poly(3-hydroxybutyrate) depolymerase